LEIEGKKMHWHLSKELVMLQFWSTQYIYFCRRLVFKIDENGLKDTKLSDIDVIVMHAPGTIKEILN
jgi:uncharacterized CHY-type Zn-finger protein